MISIVVPVYNTEKYLDEAIGSVLAQTFSDWELLLVDDGSTDNSATICKKYVDQDSRIRYIHKSNGGQASARNLGIKNARFEWIAFLDSDDLWAPEKLETQIGEIEKEKPDFLYSAGYEMFEDRNVAYNWYFKKFKGDDFFQILYRSCMVNCNTVLVSKKLLIETGLFDENQLLRGVEDWDLWMRLAKKSKVVFGSEKKLAYYRIHGDGIHLQKARIYIGKLNVYSKYDKDSSVSRLIRLRQYRYVYRELLNYLYEENRHDEIKSYLRMFVKHDSLNPALWKQWILFHLLPLKTFMWMSNKLIYRIAYRLEWLTYFLFIPSKLRS